ncbi:MAG: hypothetical protein ACRD4B_08750, partial [Acidobacteriota bacterium]
MKIVRSMLILICAAGLFAAAEQRQTQTDPTEAVPCAVLTDHRGPTKALLSATTTGVATSSADRLLPLDSRFTTWEKLFDDSKKVHDVRILLSSSVSHNVRVTLVQEGGTDIAMIDGNIKPTDRDVEATLKAMKSGSVQGEVKKRKPAWVQVMVNSGDDAGEDFTYA